MVMVERAGPPLIRTNGGFRFKNHFKRHALTEKGWLMVRNRPHENLRRLAPFLEGVLWPEKGCWL